MEHTFKEDAMMIARNILSGKNTGGTLQTAVDNGDTSYFAAAEAVLSVKRDEIEHVRNQRDKARNDAERFRFALELVVQNLVPTRSPPTGDMLLPRNDNIHSMPEKTLDRKIA